MAIYDNPSIPRPRCCIPLPEWHVFLNDQLNPEDRDVRLWEVVQRWWNLFENNFPIPFPRKRVLEIYSVQTSYLLDDALFILMFRHTGYLQHKFCAIGLRQEALTREPYMREAYNYARALIEFTPDAPVPPV